MLLHVVQWEMRAKCRSHYGL